jgi:hypothetical protein
MRGRVCRLQLLLALASAVIFGSESHTVSDSGLPFFVASYDSQGYSAGIRPPVNLILIFDHRSQIFEILSIFRGIYKLSL